MINNSNKDEALETLLICGLPVTGDYIWTRSMIRMAKEIEKMAKSTNAEMIRDSGSLIWVEPITDNFGNEFLISLVVCPSFPFKMPKVFVVEPAISAAKHVWADGSLCLMHPSEYNSSMSILEIRNMACAWCFAYSGFKATGEWPAAEYAH